MIERWSEDQVLALAPDAASRKAAARVSAPAMWSASGALPAAVWGECEGSAGRPYRTCVDLSGPGYRCSCPSRKFPCKHALGLLLLWTADAVPAAGEPPDWVAEWLRRRDRGPGSGPTAAPGAQAEGSEASGGATGRAETAARRESRVAAGLAELEQWLADQVAQGIAQTRSTGPADWDSLARRLVDAQAPGAAGVVTRLPRVLREENWPELLLAEYALLRLLAVAYRRAAELPDGLVETARSRIGFPVSRQSVLAAEPVRDLWDVLGMRDEEHDRLVTRRVWLTGRGTGRHALVLSFAPAGQPLDASLVPGTTIDADVRFYPGSSPLRALVAEPYGRVAAGPPPGTELSRLPARIAGVLAADPWADSWPVVLADVVPAAEELLDREGNALPLHPAARAPWPLIAVSGGHPVTVAAEWTPYGVRPLTTWDEQGQVVLL